MYQKTYSVNPYIPYVGGLCEGYVEGTAGQATIPTAKNQMTYGVFGTARSAWETNYGGTNHPGELPPMGVVVPVYFTLGSTPAWHVALWLGDGRIASSTQAGFHTTPFIHSSIQNLIDTYKGPNNGCTYLGWSEYIGKQQVVKKENTVAIIEDSPEWKARANKSFQMIRGRDMKDGELNAWIGGDFLHLVEALEDNPEADKQQLFANVGKDATKENWLGQISDLTSDNKRLNEELAKKPTDVVKEVPVEKIVEKEVIKEVIKGDEKRSAWDLISSGISKLFKGDK